MRAAKASMVICVLFAVLTSLCFAAQPDRIASRIDSNQPVRLRGNLHGMAQPQFDLGRVDGNQRMSGVSLVFRPSAAQQADLDNLLAQQRDSSSPNYHKWLAPAQFADRFGMSRNDINKIISWLQSQGFTVTRVANSRNQIFFEGKVAQIESAFHTEIHNYVVRGEMHFANATEPSVPAALAGATIGLHNLDNFQPKPRAHPHFTSHISGSHFIGPGDFATIYDVQAFYTNGVDGTGQKIAITGQSAINLNDVANYRSAAGLAAKAPTLTLVPGTGTSTICSGDEGESDLDVEFSGGIAKKADIALVYAGLGTGTNCNNRTAGAFDALQYAVDQNLAPVISNSYGNCETNIGSAFAQTMHGWAQQANTQGQTIISASGDSGAADCDFRVKSVTHGFAVDLPAAIPEVTGAGGTEFDPNVDPRGSDPNGTDAAATTYWSGTTGGIDTISSALSYIPEIGWNDTASDLQSPNGTVSASGGGKSIFFAKPNWQGGPGVPGDGKRDVPDISASSSADHDGYLFCSEDGATVPTCSSGFRDSNQNLAVVGGTSAAAPTLAGIIALTNQFLGNVPPNGLGNINPTLYALAQNQPAAFNDVTTGDNIVPCTAGTKDCPSAAPLQFGFKAGVGYDRVTGLGSVKAFTLAQAWSTPTFSLSADVATVAVTQGASTSFNITVTPSNGFDPSVTPLTFTCSDSAPESKCTAPSGATSQTQVSFQVTTSLPSARLQRPFDRGTQIFYAALLPGLFGVFFTARSRTGMKRGVRVLCLIMVLGIFMLGLNACGGSTNNTNKDPGTPKGSYTLTINATTGGTNPTVGSTLVTLQVN